MSILVGEADGAPEAEGAFVGETVGDPVTVLLSPTFQASIVPPEVPKYIVVTDPSSVTLNSLTIGSFVIDAGVDHICAPL